MNILSVDVEDWFHINFDKKFLEEISLNNQYSSRIEINLLKILDLLDSQGYKGTFFCLGWIARNYPHLIKEIAIRGHELGCHSYYHFLLKDLDPKSFKNDTLKAKEIISEAAGQEVISYRAPCFSLTKSVNWAFDILAECGFEVDCSIFSTPKEHGGYRELSVNKPFLVETQEKNIIKELPISLTSVGFKKICVSGGGYFRLFPYSFIKKSFTESSYNMFYIHPRDVDPNQPILDNISLSRRFKSYYGLSKCEEKLSKLLKDFKFISVKDAVKKIKWEEVPKVKILRE